MKPLLTLDEYLQERAAIFAEIDAHRPTVAAPWSSKRVKNVLNGVHGAVILAGVGLPLGLIGLGYEVGYPGQMASVAIAASGVLRGWKTATYAVLNAFGYTREISKPDMDRVVFFCTRYPNALETVAKWIASNENQVLTHREVEVITRSKEQLDSALQHCPDRGGIRDVFVTDQGRKDTENHLKIHAQAGQLDHSTQSAAPTAHRRRI